MKLQGTKILVTGGAKRIGKKICEAFANEGAKIIIHYNSSAHAAKELLEKLGGKKKGHSICKCDFSNTQQIKKMMSKLPPLDIIVNNASIYQPTPILTESESSIHKHMSINFFAPLLIIREFTKNAVAGGGLVINILDERIARISPQEGAYELSKKLLHIATKTLALQLAPTIRVNAIAPGAVLPPDTKPELKMIKQKMKTPLRKTASPEEIASTCIFIAKNDSITGQTIFIDGGRHLNNG